ncbi:hypothetical protein [Phenylobacterium sp.]|uniref:hypothetical protein n=1 Tax=Phenylobacterium sp. TaxID=1871053 RepID=UPI002F423358
MTYPAVIFWLVAIWALFARGPAIYLLFFISWSFGTLAVIPTQAVGGISIMPPWISAAVLSVKVVLDVGPRVYLGALFDYRRFGFLTLCTLYAVVSALLLPRIFAGQLDVITMRLVAVAAPTALGPTPSNFIQALYFILTSLTVVNIYFVACDPVRRHQLLVAFGWGGAVAVITGLVDLLASKAGLTGLLLPYRTSAYVLMVDGEVGDMKRVVGLMSEASAYAALCLSFLAPIAITPDRRQAAPWGGWRVPLAALLTLLTYLSTSSGGYVALVSVVLVVLVGIAGGMFDSRERAWLAAYWVMMLVVAAICVAVLRPDVVATVAKLVDAVVIHKAHTSSYVERSMWNRVAYEAFLHSHGLGAGIGCCRSSSWVFAVLSNIGAPGAILMSVFMARVFLSRGADTEDSGLMRMVKLSLLPNLFVISLTSPSVGFGLGAAWLFGLGAALAWPLAVSVETGAAAPPRAHPAFLPPLSPDLAPNSPMGSTLGRDPVGRPGGAGA